MLYFEAKKKPQGILLERSVGTLKLFQKCSFLAGDEVSTSHRMYKGWKHVSSKRFTEARSSSSGSW